MHAMDQDPMELAAVREEWLGKCRTKWSWLWPIASASHSPTTGSIFHIIFYWCHRIQYQVLLGPLDDAFGHLVIHAEATVWEDPDLRRQRCLELLSPTASSPTTSRASSDE